MDKETYLDKVGSIFDDIEIMLESNDEITLADHDWVVEEIARKLQEIGANL